MNLTRRSLFMQAAALAAITAAVPVASAETETTPADDTLTVFRSGNAVVVKDASGETVYASAGSVTWSKVAAAQLALLEKLIAADAAQMHREIQASKLLDDPEVAAIVEGTRQRAREQGWA